MMGTERGQKNTWGKKRAARRDLIGMEMSSTHKDEVQDRKQLPGMRGGSPLSPLSLPG